MTRLAFILALLPSVAAAHPLVCAPHAALMADVQRRFGEAPVAVGRIGTGLMTELTLSAAGSWTLIATDTHGVSCVLASGVDWEQTADPPLPGKDA